MKRFGSAVFLCGMILLLFVPAEAAAPQGTDLFCLTTEGSAIPF